jgi:geranylgeranyl diphosphate synthase, type I
MHKDLKLIAEAIDRLLLKDDFPSTILPDYLKSAVLAYPSRGGKRLRPAITMWFCGLFNNKPELALYPAAAIEIFHTWTLVHDDIIDQDATRRGKPSCHESLRAHAESQFGIDKAEAVQFGKSFAILAGDLQQAWAMSLLIKASGQYISSDLTLAILDRMINYLYPRLLSGEAIDVEFEHRDLNNISEEEILQMLKWKTGVLLQFAAETGALIGLNTANYRLDSVKLAGKFALSAGLAFQLQDDILGIFAEQEDLGKPVGNDLRVRKVTLLIKKSLEMSSGADHQFLQKCLGNKNLTTQDLFEARNIIKRCGALGAIEEMAKDCIEKAKDSLTQLPNNNFRTLLDELADFFIQRKY